MVLFASIDADLTALTPIQVPLIRGCKYDKFKNLRDGKISAEYGTSETFPIATLALGIFSNPSGLVSKGNGRFSQSNDSGILTLGAPTSRGFASTTSRWA